MDNNELSTNLAEVGTDAISRDDVLRIVDYYGQWNDYHGREREAIEQLPPIQPDPHIGLWEPVGVAEVVGGESAMWGSAIAYHKCSQCGEQALEEDGEEKLSDFCPHCGAKMEVNNESN